VNNRKDNTAQKFHEDRDENSVGNKGGIVVFREDGLQGTQTNVRGGAPKRNLQTTIYPFRGEEQELTNAKRERGTRKGGACEKKGSETTGKKSRHLLSRERGQATA